MNSPINLDLIDKIVTFNPLTKSQNGALGNHTKYRITGIMGSDILIRCTCHSDADYNQDMRWVKAEQLSYATEATAT